MVNLMLGEAFTTTFWKWIIKDVFSFVELYGLRVIIITVIIKLILSPFDFYTRKKGIDNAKIMEKMQPELQRLQKQYANNPRELQLKRQALNKKYGYSMFSTCLPLLLTLIVFFTLLPGFTATAKQLNIDTYTHLQNSYSQYYNSATAPLTDDSKRELVIDSVYISKANAFNNEWYNYEIAKLKNIKANKDLSEEELHKLLVDNLEKSGMLSAGKSLVISPDDQDIFTQENVKAELKQQYIIVSKYIAQKEVWQIYENGEKESFLWMKNIWRPDTWKNPIFSQTEFQQLTGMGAQEGFGEEGWVYKYNDVMGRVLDEYQGKWNGYLILVVFSLTLTILSTLMSMRQQKLNADPTQQSAASSMKFMMYMGPIMIGYFALTQSGAFTLYMVTQSFMTLLINLLSTAIIKVIYKNKEDDTTAPYARKK